MMQTFLFFSRRSAACTLVFVVAVTRVSASTHVQFQDIHTFEDSIEGATPSDLVQATDGNLYGLTSSGGSYGQGTFFTMTRDGAVRVLHSFDSVLDGVALEGLGGRPHGLIQVSSGDFYATALHSVLRLTPLGAVSIGYTFPDLFSYPGSLVQGPDGNLYGVTVNSDRFGVPGGGGTVFRLTPAGVVTTLRALPGGYDALGRVFIGRDQQIYGTTYPEETGSLLGGPTVYRMSLTGVVTTLNMPHVFNLVEGEDGALYGFGDGLYRRTPDGMVTLVRALPRLTTFNSVIRARDGQFYENIFFRNLTQAADGTFYGIRSSFPAIAARVAFRMRATVAATPSGDFDGDAKSDITVIRPSTGVWYILQSSAGFGASLALPLGSSTDVAVPSDYDGDGRIDPAVYRPSTGVWSFLTSSSGYTSHVTQAWGISTDIPVPGDYDGDGRADLAVFRTSTGTWYILQSRANYTTYTSTAWGLSTDVPVPSDYDGDGQADIAVYRPSTGRWYVLQSTTNNTTYLSFPWGTGTDIAVPGDYDGDGKADPAVYRPSTGMWYALTSSSHYTAFVNYSWGFSTDVPVPADFDGDGKTDVAVFRSSSGTWFILQSSSNFTTFISKQWGTNGDSPINGRP